LVETPIRRTALNRCPSFADIAVEMTERRAEHRSVVMARIELSWHDQAGDSHTAAAKIEDKSDSGVCIRVKESIPAGVKVSVKWHGGQFTATVMNCRPVGNEFLVGVQKAPAEVREPV
jgi:hypothetical protein